MPEKKNQYLKKTDQRKKWFIYKYLCALFSQKAIKFEII